MKKFSIGLVFLCLSLTNVFATELDSDTAYSVENGQFVTAEGKIPSGCFAQLITELNGDNTVAAIYINRASLRGCVAANIPYPGGYDAPVSYQIIEPLGNDSYKLQVCLIGDGSLGAYCDKIMVKFNHRSYKTPSTSAAVLVLEKTGEWQ